ncbi:DNA-directed RNA polymerase I subunit RPA49 [Caerostris extrusa]|uniref:DNA-directed RNA polymerase I subunit RPA49 n=1 Tax=Caerostris extrusa TaxID=172846 RepID=A0AAV4NQV4_CAEEX|nr:DNA-directed RNA polymerase I subunit RPA49 [Caerostris extrusa]
MADDSTKQNVNENHDDKNESVTENDKDNGRITEDECVSKNDIAAENNGEILNSKCENDEDSGRITNNIKKEDDLDSNIKIESDSINENDVDEIAKIKLYRKREKRVPIFAVDFTQASSRSNFECLQLDCFKKKSDSKKVGAAANRQLVAHNGRITYVGSSNAVTHHNFVAVRNPTTGRMRLYDCVLFRMKPEMKVAEADDTPTSTKSYWDGFNELTEQFGSKTRKRALDMRKQLTTDESVLDGSALENLTIKEEGDQSSTIDTSSTSAAQSSPADTPTTSAAQQIDYLPPQNRAASSVRKVFDIAHIISPEEDSSLSKEVQELKTPLDATTKARLLFCKFADQRFDKVSPEKQKYLVYYNYLVAFQQLKAQAILKKDPAPDIPQPYKDNILSRFTLMAENNQGRKVRTRPNKLNDKLVAYIFVLALIIDEFKINIEETIDDLRNVGVNKFKLIAETLGCHITKHIKDRETIHYAELKLPLAELKSASMQKYAGKFSTFKRR